MSEIVSKPATKEYRSNYDRIFTKTMGTTPVEPSECSLCKGSKHVQSCPRCGAGHLTKEVPLFPSEYAPMQAELDRCHTIIKQLCTMLDAYEVQHEGRKKGDLQGSTSFTIVDDLRQFLEAKDPYMLYNMMDNTYHALPRHVIRIFATPFPMLLVCDYRPRGEFELDYVVVFPPETCKELSSSYTTPSMQVIRDVVLRTVNKAGVVWENPAWNAENAPCPPIKLVTGEEIIDLNLMR